VAGFPSEYPDDLPWNTHFCLRLSFGETAVLRVDAKKVAKLIFNDDEEYFVEGIFFYPS